MVPAASITFLVHPCQVIALECYLLYERRRLVCGHYPGVIQ